jgi:hypothetical protein
MEEITLERVSLLIRYFPITNGILGIPNIDILLSILCWIPEGKWGSLRYRVVEKGVHFLWLCRLREKRAGGLG